MFRRAWKPFAVATVAVPSAVYYYNYGLGTSTGQESFNLAVRVRNAQGNREMETRSFPLQKLGTIDSRIKENATAHSDTRPSGTTWNHTTASLASNDPIEDANAHQIIQRDDSSGDLLFFAVMDGHGGFHTSQLLAKILIKAVALELSNLIANPPPTATGFLSSVKSAFYAPTNPVLVDGKPKDMSLAIQNAFSNLDTELISAPLRLLANNIDAEAKRLKYIPDLSSNPMAMTTMLPALSGSCALLTLIDTAHDDLYVACSGDSRAVAGVWDTSDGKGSWKVEVLTEDQTGRNPNELKRIQSEHPASEANDVVRNGRILGGLEPSRAFGDARYKWPVELQNALNIAFLQGNKHPMRNPPPLLKTPPYVTARPVVTHRKLSSTEENNSLRFIVMATDGLWDELTSEEVVQLVGGHLNGIRGVVSNDQLSSKVPLAPTSSKGIDGKSHQKRKHASWAFIDDNLSAHLIRNAFGGADELALRQVLSIPPPLSRNYRDDITVTVVWWDDAQGKNSNPQVVRAKL